MGSRALKPGRVLLIVALVETLVVYNNDNDSRNFFHCQDNTIINRVGDAWRQRSHDPRTLEAIQFVSQFC